VSSDTPRTTLDLVSELHEASEGAFMASLIVGFKEHTEYMSATEPDPLESLNEKVERGGQPLGICRFTKDGQGIGCNAWPLREFADDDFVKNFISEQVATFKGNLERFLMGESLEDIGLTNLNPNNKMPR